jgi:type IV fimbrial biogenesis protein FimT
MENIKHKNPLQHTGFTIVELLITLTVATVLIALATSLFNNFIQQVRLTIATNELISAMNLARMEAIKRNGRVDLIAHENNWKNGWIISADNQLIFNHEGLHKDIEVDSKFTSKSKTYIAYNGTGRTRTDANSYTAQSGSIRLSLGEYSRLIVVNFLGRVRVCNPATAAKGTCVNAASEE